MASVLALLSQGSFTWWLIGYGSVHTAGIVELRHTIVTNSWSESQDLVDGDNCMMKSCTKMFTIFENITLVLKFPFDAYLGLKPHYHLSPQIFSTKGQTGKRDSKSPYISTE